MTKICPQCGNVCKFVYIHRPQGMDPRDLEWMRQYKVHKHGGVYYVHDGDDVE